MESVNCRAGLDHHRLRPGQSSQWNTVKYATAAPCPAKCFLTVIRLAAKFEILKILLIEKYCEEARYASLRLFNDKFRSIFCV